MTHVGLVNMGRIMIRTGHGNVIPTGSKGTKGEDDKKGGVTVTVDAVDGWQAVGRRIAFRDTIVKRSDMTASFEEEMLEYALHLIRGGAPFYSRSGAGTKHKVTKTTRTKTRSRSQSRGPLGLGKGGAGQMYVMRKKSVSRPSTEKVEIVQREWESESGSDGARRRLLALPAPDSPASSRQYVEIKPSSATGSSSDSEKHDPDLARSRDHDEASNGRHERRRQSTREEPGEHTQRQPQTSRAEIRARRRDIRATIRAEQEEAITELERQEQAYRTKRHQTKMARPLFHSREDEERYEMQEEEDDIIAFMAEQYGVHVEPLPVPREPIDNGLVKDIPPPTASGIVEAISSDSEDSDSPPSPPRHRSMNGRPMDRLRAQTYRGPIRRHSFMPWSERFEPYPGTYESGRYPGRPRRNRPFYEEGSYRPHEYGASPPSIIVDEELSPPRRRYPSRPYYRGGSDDRSGDEFYIPKRHPRGPDPDGAPAGMSEKEMIIKAIGDKEHPSSRSHRKSSLRPGPGELHQRYSDVPHDELRPQGFDDHRTKGHGRRRREDRRHKGPEVDFYMSGARSENGSGDSEEGDGIRIVRN
jgi:hypothetical protein